MRFSNRNKCVCIFVLLFLTFTLLESSFARNISDVMGNDGNDFDPWNITRWADWYEDGVPVEPFEIDISVTFADKSSPWQVDMSSMGDIFGSHPTLIAVSADKSITINGNGLVIDARKDYVRNWDLQYYYENNVHPDVFYNCNGITFMQENPETSGDSGSVVDNITLKGFTRAIASSHSHSRKVTVQYCTLETNKWALFPRGAGITVHHCNIWENISGGLYGEYNSRNWVFRDNVFRDNDTKGTNSYGDIVLDACYNYEIYDNDFLPPSYTPRTYHTAISLYRNRGETGDIREHSSHSHIIRNNNFNDYHIAIDFSPRMGLINNNDQSHEARCYASENLVKNNIFNDCIIGIVQRNSFNVIESNTFNNVDKEVVLHNVFYSMYHNVIKDQPDSTVWLWSVEDDYTDYSQYVLPYNQNMGADIEESEKFYHIVSPSGTPSFAGEGSAELFVTKTILVPEKCDIDSSAVVDFNDIELLSGSWLTEGENIPYSRQTTNINMQGNVDSFDFAECARQWMSLNKRLDAYTSGGKPTCMAVGDMAVYEPGDEIAVIWNRPVSNIAGTDYFTIIIYNQYGLELDRCGRSQDRWAKIVTGNFLPDTGWIKENDNYEIAAIKTLPDANGHYPIYIFRKGFKDPAVILLENNPTPFTDLAGGNFDTSSNYFEIAYKLDGTNKINYIRPDEPGWSETTDNVSSDIISLSGGNYDGIESNGEEIAAISSEPGPVLFYRPGENSNYSTAADTGKNWTLISGGNFDGGSRPRDEVAVISDNTQNGTYMVEYFSEQDNVPFKQTNVDALNILPACLSSGNLVIDSSISDYEKIINLSNQNFLDNVSGWGEHLAVLPSESVSESIPLFWICTSNQNNNKSHYRLVPLLK